MKNNLSRIIKHKLFRISTAVIAVLLLSWGVSSVADDNIKSATNNFSAMGLVLEISGDSFKIKEAKGSDKSGNTTYDLNIENLEITQTNKNEPLNFTDIKEGDRVIVQGLTNGSTFFIKRIISFTSTPTLVATTTDEVAATTTVTDEGGMVSTSTATTSETETGNETVVETLSIPITPSASSTDENVIATSTSTSTSTDETTTATSTATPPTTSGIIDTIIDTVKEVIENIVETITGDIPTPTPEAVQQIVENTEAE